MLSFPRIMEVLSGMAFEILADSITGMARRHVTLQFSGSIRLFEAERSLK